MRLASTMQWRYGVVILTLAAVAMQVVGALVVFTVAVSAGPDTGVDNLHKVEGPGPLGGPGGPGPSKGRRRKVKEKGEKRGKRREKPVAKRHQMVTGSLALLNCFFYCFLYSYFNGSRAAAPVGDEVL